MAVITTNGTSKVFAFNGTLISGTSKSNYNQGNQANLRSLVMKVINDSQNAYVT